MAVNCQRIGKVLFPSEYINRPARNQFPEFWTLCLAGGRVPTPFSSFAQKISPHSYFVRAKRIEFFPDLLTSVASICLEAAFS